MKRVYNIPSCKGQGVEGREELPPNPTLHRLLLFFYSGSGLLEVLNGEVGNRLTYHGQAVVGLPRQAVDGLSRQAVVSLSRQAVVGLSRQAVVSQSRQALDSLSTHAVVGLSRQAGDCLCSKPALNSKKLGPEWTHRKHIIIQKRITPLQQT